MKWCFTNMPKYWCSFLSPLFCQNLRIFLEMKTFLAILPFLGDLKLCATYVNDWTKIHLKKHENRNETGSNGLSTADATVFVKLFFRQWKCILQKHKNTTILWFWKTEKNLKKNLLNNIKPFFGMSMTTNLKKVFYLLLGFEPTTSSIARDEYVIGLI